MHRRCHPPAVQKMETAMSDDKKKCQKPENLTGKPEECSPEQIRKCHGDVKKHPCTEKPSGNEQGDGKGRA